VAVSFKGHEKGGEKRAGMVIERANRNFQYYRFRYSDSKKKKVIKFFILNCQF
jgi:hypothetical protein